MITDTLALLVLAIVVGMSAGEADSHFWTKLGISVTLFAAVVMVLFPIIGRWFLKRYSDNVTQYIFVLVMVFLGAFLAELAGIEAIIGAFLSGLALNRLIPSTSALMNRVEFVGNAIFIPFFLIGVGMLVDVRTFFKDAETIKVAIIMTVIATLAKFLAAWLTQKTFRFTVNERKIIFGLSNAQAAATLAAVMVGYKVVLGTDAGGNPIRLLNESVLNGTIVMILVTCTIATFSAQKGGQNLALANPDNEPVPDKRFTEKILIPLSNPDTIEELIALSTIIKTKENQNELYALNIVNTDAGKDSSEAFAHKLLHKAAQAASATDVALNQLVRYDINAVNGIAGVVKEQGITDLVLGLHVKKGLTESFLGSLTEGVLAQCNITTFIYKAAQPIATIKRHVVLVPPNAQFEPGFAFWLSKVWNMARNTGAKLVVFGSQTCIDLIRDIKNKYPVEAEFAVFDNWADFLIIGRDIKENDNLVLVMSREHKPSYQKSMAQVPHYLNTYFKTNSFVLVYPKQSGLIDPNAIQLINPSMTEPIEKLDELGRTIARLFKR
jgi:Kef-type K+ transport system membrane component KefB